MLLVPKLRMRGSLPPLPGMTSQCNVGPTLFLLLLYRQSNGGSRVGSAFELETC